LKMSFERGTMHRLRNYMNGFPVVLDQAVDH
jgi:hypothetical protein